MFSLHFFDGLYYSVQKSIAVLFPNFLFFTLCDGSLPVRWGFSVMAEGGGRVSRDI